MSKLFPGRSTYYAAALLIALVFSLLETLPLPWNDMLENATLKLQFRLRGQRPLDENILFVYLGSEDIAKLGGWPITRDYYGYMTHVLTELRAKAIGFYLMFDTPDPRFPEYDAMLADFFRKSGRVVLPMAFQEITPAARGALQGKMPVEPLPEFRENAAAVGFSNLTETTPTSVPLALTSQSCTYRSFGVELANVYANGNLALPPQKRILLNHFGDLQKVRKMGFLDLLQTFERTPDSLNLQDKLVIIDVTAPGLPNLVRTPFSPAMPASLVHATIAENLLHGSFLTPLNIPLRWTVILILSFSAVLSFLASRDRYKLLTALLILFLFVTGAQILFSKANLFLPLFYPVLAFLNTFTLQFVFRLQTEKSRVQIMQGQLMEKIAEKESELQRQKQELRQVQNQLASGNAESQKLHRLAEEHKQQIARLEKHLRDLEGYRQPQTGVSSPQFPEIVHAPGGRMSAVLAMVEKVAAEDIPVLISGETGTGKELAARALHNLSPRRSGPFVAVNCGALPETLLESELFGHERGAFTGAQSRRKGRFELAHGGTIFLDEITETSPPCQAKLLRVLQDGTFERIGGERTLRSDVRVIAATNADIRDQIEKRAFREDLFYRLNGVQIALPPLRERKEDIPLLVDHFLQQQEAPDISGISRKAMSTLLAYSWPGNVRELENVIRRAAILARSEHRPLIQQADLPEEIVAGPKGGATYVPFEEQVLHSLRRLKFSRAAISRTARELGNRDRGTVTEHFRGLCFRYLVEHEFYIRKAAGALAGSSDAETVQRVQSKIREYLKNLTPLPGTPLQNYALPPQFKGLPKRFHPFLKKVLERLRQSEIDS